MRGSAKARSTPCAARGRERDAGRAGLAGLPCGGVGFTIAYAAAGGRFLIGGFGLAGGARDPLAGVFLVPLGLPWNLLVDAAPEAAWPWLGALAPAANLALLALVCRWRGAGGGRGDSDSG